MKVVITVKLDTNDPWPVVGTNNRVLISVANHKAALKRAKAIAKGRECRLEFFTDQGIYAPQPYHTEYLAAKA